MWKSSHRIHRGIDLDQGEKKTGNTSLCTSLVVISLGALRYVWSHVEMTLSCRREEPGRLSNIAGSVRVGAALSSELSLQ